jgi:hypothetical protein
MMRKPVLALLLLLAACGPAATPQEKKEQASATPGISLGADEVKNLGIAVVPARPATWRRQITGYGVVTALDAVAQADSDFRTASAAAAQSAAAAARARSLATGEEAAVSREVVEAAQSKAAADRAALELARRKADSAFGLHAPWRGPGARDAIMARLASGKTVLVRVTFPLGALGSGVPQSLSVRRPGSTQSWAASTIWEAPADPALPGRGFYVLVDGSDLAQNEHVVAAVPTGPMETGVTVPAAALVIGQGESWVYTEKSAGHFLRIPVDTGKPLGEGYFVPGTGGLAAGEKVVTAGAGLLLSRELNPGGGGED